MLGNKLSRKDVDFIILLSTYLLNEDYSTIQDKITRLAELGQVNAIQYFYLMKPEFEVNYKIDKKLEGLLGVESFEVDFAVKNYLNAKKKTDEHFPNKYEGIEKLEGKTVFEAEKECFKKIKLLLEQNQNPIIFERYLEIKFLLGKKLTIKDRQNIKKIEEKLLKNYKENPKNVENTFALAKLMALFSEDDNHKILGKQILSEISKIELSSKMKEVVLPQSKLLRASVSILGPSGYGKKALLNKIEGLNKKTDGNLYKNERSTKEK